VPEDVVHSGNADTPFQNPQLIIGRKVKLVAVTGYAMDCFLEQLFGVPRPGRFLPKFALHGRQMVSTPPPSFTKPVQDSVVIDGIEWKSVADVTADGEIKGGGQKTSRPFSPCGQGCCINLH
jgi:hypothetical protein